jgi:hypothetical protein
MSSLQRIWNRSCVHISCSAVVARRRSCNITHPEARFLKRSELPCFRGEDEKRHDHQRRIPVDILEVAKRRLQECANELRNASSFDELYALIESKIGNVSGIGDLTVYDVAHRIGAYLNLEPQSVYLHAGTRDGARLFGLQGREIHHYELPLAFQKLSPAEIEDCLCIYREHIRRIISRAR